MGLKQMPCREHFSLPENGPWTICELHMAGLKFQKSEYAPGQTHWAEDRQEEGRWQVQTERRRPGCSNRGLHLSPPNSDSKEKTQTSSPNNINPSERKKGGARWFSNSHNVFQALKRSRCYFLSLLAHLLPLQKQGALQNHSLHAEQIVH